MNSWRGQTCAETDQGCPVCTTKAQESVLHRFRKCSNTSRAWRWGIYILHLLTPAPNIGIQLRQVPKGTARGTGHQEVRNGIQYMSQIECIQSQRLTRFSASRKHCVFACRIPRRFKKASRFWLLLRGIIMWVLRIERNDAAFNGI